ncbi:hypothetical protein BG003_008075 [Podila horticola]|nr:hypothetical protein BG003_008075 [Podila horticola]
MADLRSPSWSSLFKSYRSWTYEFCYKGAIRQYYEADTDENNQPHKYAPVFVLGRFHPPPTGLESLEEHKDYQCALISEARIHSVTEPTICSYVIVINSPQLCIDPAFRVIRPPVPEPIQCRPIVLETKEAVGKFGPSSLAAPQKIAQLSGHMLKDHPVDENLQVPSSNHDNDGNGRQGKRESETGNALLGYFGSLRLSSSNYPMETTGVPSGSKDSASEQLQNEELDHRIPAQLSNMMTEIEIEVLEQKDSQSSINQYSEHIKESIKNGGRIPIHDLPQEVVAALEEAKESLEDEVDAEEDSTGIDEDWPK